MYLQDHLILISLEEIEEEEVGMSQVSTLVEEVAADEEVDLDMDAVKEEDLDMDKVEAEDAVEVDVVDVVVVVEDVEEEAITTVTTEI